MYETFLMHHDITRQTNVNLASHYIISKYFETIFWNIDSIRSTIRIQIAQYGGMILPTFVWEKNLAPDS